MALTRDQLLTDLARALRMRTGDEADAHVRAIEPWLEVGWPLPRTSKSEVASPRAAVDAAELAVVDAFPDRAPELLRALARVSAAAMLAETIAYDSIRTSQEGTLSPFRRVAAEAVAFENPEAGFQRADAAGRETLLREITDERAASLIRRRVKLKPAVMEGGRILLTRLTEYGSAELPFSDYWLEIVTLDETTQRGGPVDCLVTWIPSYRYPAVTQTIEAGGGMHVWAADVADRWEVRAWTPGWLR